MGDKRAVCFPASRPLLSWQIGLGGLNGSSAGASLGSGLSSLHCTKLQHSSSVNEKLGGVPSLCFCPGPAERKHSVTLMWDVTDYFGIRFEKWNAVSASWEVLSKVSVKAIILNYFQNNGKILSNFRIFHRTKRKSSRCFYLGLLNEWCIYLIRPCESWLNSCLCVMMHPIIRRHQRLIYQHPHTSSPSKEQPNRQMVMFRDRKHLVRVTRRSCLAFQNL